MFSVNCMLVINSSQKDFEDRNNCSSEAPLIRNRMAHTPVDTHYAIPVNTSILPMPYLVPRTLSTFNITLVAHLSVLSTPLLVQMLHFIYWLKLPSAQYQIWRTPEVCRRKETPFP